MVYEWKTAACISIDAQTAGEVCERLSQKGELTAKRLLEDSRPESAPLHKAFEWDDSAAAEKYREGQARHIINCLTVRTEKQEQVRAFFKLESVEAYKSTESILMVQAERLTLLDMARRDWQIYEQKYKLLAELAPLLETAKEIGLETA